MTMKIKLNEYYYQTEDGFFCCDEYQYRTYCEAHVELMGCYYCEFDYSKPCECEE
jgi:hypothetical protein